MIVSVVECPAHGKQGIVVIKLPANDEAPPLFQMKYKNGKVRSGRWGQDPRPPCLSRLCTRQLMVYCP